MAWLKGPLESGVVQINKPVKFNKYVQSGIFDPWVDTWYVDATDGSDSHTGRGPADAKATIQAAVTASGVGDVIYIRPKAWTSLPYSYPGLNTAYAESVSIPYAKAGIAIIGVANASFKGVPHGVVIRETASATTANMKVYAPMCSFENLAFERGGTETGGQLVFQGGTAATYEGNAATVYNCYFYYGNGTTGPGTTGGSIMADQIWGLDIEKCHFLGCRIGVYFQSGGATSGNLLVRGSTFMSRNLTANDIAADVYVYTQGATSIEISHNSFAHLIPSLGAPQRWISVQADVRQGLIAFNSFAGVTGTNYTVGPTGTGVICPANIGHGPNYCNAALMASTTP